MTDAYETERIQNWMGVAYHPSCTNYFKEVRAREDELSALEEFGFLRRFLIPLKKDLAKSRAENRPEYTVDWPSLALMHLPLIDFESICNEYKEQATDKMARQKWENTLKYFHKCRNESQP